MNNSLITALLKAADTESARNLLRELTGVEMKSTQNSQLQGAKPVQQVKSVQSQNPKPAPSIGATSMSERIIVDQSSASTVVQPEGIDSSNPIYAEEIGTNTPILSLEPDAVLNGIVWSEILGKPKSRRRH